MDRVCVRDDENENHEDENNDPEQESANGNYSPRLQSENVLGHKIEGIAAMQTKACHQRLRALFPEPRMVDQGDEVVRFQRRSVKTPAVFVKDVVRRVRCGAWPDDAQDRGLATVGHLCVGQVGPGVEDMTSVFFIRHERAGGRAWPGGDCGKETTAINRAAGQNFATWHGRHVALPAIEAWQCPPV